MGIDVMSDTTGQAIVAAIKSTDVVAERKEELDTYAEELKGDIQKKGEDVIATFPEDFTQALEDIGNLESGLSSAKEAIADLTDKKITKFYASNQGNTHLPDSDKGKIQDMYLYGKSEQVQYKGKNLFDAKGLIGDKSVSNNGITFKYDSVNDMFTISGMATTEAINAYLFGGYTNTNVIFTLSAGTYTFSTTLQTVVMYAYDGSTRNTYVITSSGKTFTFDSDVGITALKPGNQVVGTTVNESFKIQIEKGSTKTDYEPYVGGIPSPNPDYPQEIKAVVNPKVVVRGKNLLDVSNCVNAKNLVSGLEDGYIKFKKAGALWGESYIGKFSYRKGEKISISSFGDFVYGRIGFSDSPTKYPAVDSYIYDKSGSAAIRVLSKDKTVAENIELNYDGIVYCWYCSDYNTASAAEFQIRLQVEVGETATPYEPYIEQSTPLPYTLYAIPVSTGGNITIGNQQYIADYVDVERGKLVRMCRKTTITIAPSRWETMGDNGYYCDERFDNISTEVNYQYLLSDIFAQAEGKSLWNAMTDGTGYKCQITISNKSIRFYVENDLLPVETITVLALYPLGTPEEIDLTPEEISAFKSLSTNYPVTNIEVSSDQLDGYTVFNYPISMAEGWNYVKQQIGDTRDYIYDMDLQSAEAYVNSEYAVALTELEVM